MPSVFLVDLGTRYSSIDVEYQSAIGNFRNSSDHQRFEFMVLDHYYQEAGLIWNRFLGSNFGIGFSYRLGYYRTPEFSNNFGIKIKFNAFDR